MLVGTVDGETYQVWKWAAGVTGGHVPILHGPHPPRADCPSGPSAILIVNSDEYINPASTAGEPPRGHLQTQLESRPSIRPSHRSHHTTARSQQDVRIASRRSQPVSRRRIPHLRKREPTWLRHRLHTQDAARQLQPHQLPQVRRRRRQHQDLQQLRRREFPPSGLPLLSPASSPPPILSPICLSAPLSLSSRFLITSHPRPIPSPRPHARHMAQGQNSKARSNRL